MTFEEAYRESVCLGFSHEQIARNLDNNITVLADRLSRYLRDRHYWNVTADSRAHFRSKARACIADIRKAREWKTCLAAKEELKCS